MKRVIFSLLVVCMMASASFAQIDSIYATAGRVGIGLWDSMIGIETNITGYKSSGTTLFELGLRGQMPIAKHGKNVTSSLALLLLSSSGPTTTQATLGVSLLYSLECKVTDQLALFGDVTLIGTNDISNASNSLNIITSNAQIYTGGRLYL
ncbi:MAG: hypothetical protein WC901_02680 [Candidatus Margulisiibacteriota bacterium]